MNTNAQLFATFKRDEIELTFTQMHSTRTPDYHTPQTMADFYQHINRPTFWSTFVANYAEYLLGENK